MRKSRLEARRADAHAGSHPGARCRMCDAMIKVMSKRADFLAANKGLRVARPGFVLLAHPNDGKGKRYGITVTKKVGNAVVRNRMKRRFRELLRAALPELGLPDHDHVLIGRDRGIERDFAKLEAELAEALSRVGAGKGDPPRRRPRRGDRRGSHGLPRHKTK